MTLPREEHDDRDRAAPVTSEPERERSVGEPESVPPVRWPRPDLLFPAVEETAPPGQGALRPEAPVPAPAPASAEGPPTQAMPTIERAAEAVPVAAPTEPDPVREPEAVQEAEAALEPDAALEPEPVHEAEAALEPEPVHEPDVPTVAIVVPEPPRRRRGIVGVFFEGVKLVLVIAITAVLVAGLVAGAFALLAVVLREAVS